MADCLSRAKLGEEDELEGLPGIIHTMTKLVCLLEDYFDNYRNILKEDEDYNRICRYLETSWPRFHQLNDKGQHFYKFRAELHVENGLLLLNHKLVIPTKLQEKLITWLHGPHLGIEKTLARAREFYYGQE